MSITKAPEFVEMGVAETLAYYEFPEAHWRLIRTNNPLERILREIPRFAGHRAWSAPSPTVNRR